jgi:hypothetical protein
VAIVVAQALEAASAGEKLAVRRLQAWKARLSIDLGDQYATLSKDK